MPEPINLNRIRKEKARVEKRAKGNANAAKHGRTKPQKAKEAVDRARSERSLDQHKREE